MVLRFWILFCPIIAESNSMSNNVEHHLIPYCSPDIVKFTVFNLMLKSLYSLMMSLAISFMFQLLDPEMLFESAFLESLCGLVFCNYFLGFLCRYKCCAIF